MRVIDFPQGSAEWLASRAGRVTASRISDVLARVKNGDEAAARRNYRAQIVAEILTGKPQEAGFVNDEMRWGTEQEPFARAAYEVATETLVDQVGLVLHPEIDRAAASPDGLAGKGLLEIKCPLTATHIDYMLVGKPPEKYRNQMFWQMACTEREWCDFVSFDPRLPQDFQLFRVRLERDDKAIKKLEAEVRTFLAEVDEVLEKLNSRKAA